MPLPTRYPGSPIAAQEQILQAMLGQAITGAEPEAGDFFLPLAIQETRLENLTARRDRYQTRYTRTAPGLDAWIEYRLRVERTIRCMPFCRRWAAARWKSRQMADCWVTLARTLRTTT